MNLGFDIGSIIHLFPSFLYMTSKVSSMNFRSGEFSFSFIRFFTRSCPNFSVSASVSWRHYLQVHKPGMKLGSGVKLNLPSCLPLRRRNSTNSLYLPRGCASCTTYPIGAGIVANWMGLDSFSQRMASSILWRSSLPQSEPLIKISN